MLFEGRVLSLKHFQDNVAEARESQEGGIRIEGYSNFEVGDIIEVLGKAKTLERLGAAVAYINEKQADA